MKKFLPSIFSYTIFLYLFLIIIFYNHTAFTSIPNNYPADISFCIADLKYDGQNIKICELGDGVLSMFQGYDNLHEAGKEREKNREKGQIWTSFWDFLKQFDIPLLLIGTKPQRTRYQEMSLGHFTKLGGRFIDKITKLEEQILLKKLSQQKNLDKKLDIYNIRSSMACTIMRNGFAPTYLVTRSMSKHPALIFLDNSTKEFVSSKYLTNKIFHDAKLEAFRPICKSYNKIYTEKLAQEITRDIPGNIYVIKPINAAQGNGIIMVERHNLDKILRIILKQDQLPTNLSRDTSYTHWIKDSNTIFLVEEFVLSKTITVDKKLYDPTMRVIFVMYNDNKQAQIKFLGSYWKLPAKSLDEHATLTEQYKSKIVSNRTSSAPVNNQDYEHVQQILEPVLCAAYIKMLESKYHAKA